jgi:transposase
MPEAFYELARPMLPAERESGPQGGRPPIEHSIVLKVIWFVLVTGCRWKDVPREMGCCGETARTRLQAWERAGIWGELHKLLLTMLRQANELHAETAIIDSTQVRAMVQPKIDVANTPVFSMTASLIGGRAQGFAAKEPGTATVSPGCAPIGQSGPQAPSPIAKD